jgi:hypothetical protein
MASGGSIDPLGFLVLETVLMTPIAPPVFTQAFAMFAGGSAAAGGPVSAMLALMLAAAVMTGEIPPPAHIPISVHTPCHVS